MRSLSNEERDAFEQALSQLEPQWEAAVDCGVPRHITLPGVSLKECILSTVARRFGDTQVVYQGEKYSFAFMNEQACRFAQGLLARGFEKGDVLCVMLGDVPQLIVAYMACYKIGCVAVGVNPRSTKDEVARYVRECKPKALVASRAHMRMVAESLDASAWSVDFLIAVEEVMASAAAGTVGETAEIAGDTAAARAAEVARAACTTVQDGAQIAVVSFAAFVAEAPSAAEPDAEVLPDDVAVLIYTGGTTGVPKACPLTHRILVWAQYFFYAMLRPRLHNACNMTTLLTSPMTHAYGLNFGVNWGVVIGGTVVIARSLDGASIVHAIEAYHVNVWGAVSALLGEVAACVQQPAAREGMAQKEMAREDPVQPAVLRKEMPQKEAARQAVSPLLESLEVVVVSCTVSSREAIERFSSVCNAAVVEDYGMTETGGPVTLTPAVRGAAAGSVGVPVANTDVLVVDVETGCKPLAAGERGEIVFRGPQVISGYAGNPGETEKAFRDGWIYSGDVGSFDERGYLHVVGRIKDVIEVGGFSVFPREIDEVVRAHPLVMDSCTVGVFDERSGERPCSFVVANPGAELLSCDVVGHCHEHLIAYKCPKYVVFVREIPLTLAGKPDKQKLQTYGKSLLEAGSASG